MQQIKIVGKSMKSSARITLGALALAAATALGISAASTDSVAATNPSAHGKTVAATVSGDNYKVDVTKGACPGGKCTFNVVMTVTNKDYHVNQEHPTKWTETDGKTVTFDKAFIGNKIQITVKSDGTSIKGKFKGGLCTNDKTKCQTVDIEVSGD